MRSRSYSPSPPRGGNGRMGRSPSPRVRYDGGGGNGRMGRSPSPRVRYDGGGGNGRMGRSHSPRVCYDGGGGNGRMGRSPSPRVRYDGGGGNGRMGSSPVPRVRYDGGGSRDQVLSASLLVRNLRLLVRNLRLLVRNLRLLVRNLHYDCKVVDLWRRFEQYGPIKDIYLPRDYYTRKPLGIGFIEFGNSADAAEAKVHTDGKFLLGRKMTVTFAKHKRKKPSDMRAKDPGRGPLNDRRRFPHSYSRSPRHSRSPPPRHSSSSPPCHSRSPPLSHGRSRSRSNEDYSPHPQGRKNSRSVSLGERSHSRNLNPQNEHSPDGRSPKRSPEYDNGSRSPVMGEKVVRRSPSRSRSQCFSE